jgi:RNase H-like domain found in reverse transcriptase
MDWVRSARRKAIVLLLPKFDTSTAWPLPVQAESLSYFIRWCTFYNFVPWFKQRAGPLYQLENKLHRQRIPSNERTTDLRSAFDNLKTALTQDPLLQHYNAALPCFLKTDWSTTAMGFIPMQLANPNNAGHLLDAIGNPKSVEFDRLLSGSPLQPLCFGSRRCTEAKRHYHSFTWEVAGGLYAMSCCRMYLMGSHFFWMCDCNSVKEIYDYTGDNHQLRRWAQELFCYNFTAVHLPACMMRDVDALS